MSISSCIIAVSGVRGHAQTASSLTNDVSRNKGGGMQDREEGRRSSPAWCRVSEASHHIEEADHSYAGSAVGGAPSSPEEDQGPDETAEPRSSTHTPMLVPFCVLVAHMLVETSHPQPAATFTAGGTKHSGQEAS